MISTAPLFFNYKTVCNDLSRIDKGWLDLVVKLIETVKTV